MYNLRNHCSPCSTKIILFLHCFFVSLHKYKLAWLFWFTNSRITLGWSLLFTLVVTPTLGGFTLPRSHCHPCYIASFIMFSWWSVWIQISSILWFISKRIMTGNGMAFQSTPARLDHDSFRCSLQWIHIHGSLLFHSLFSSLYEWFGWYTTIPSLVYFYTFYSPILANHLGEFDSQWTCCVFKQ